MTVAVNHRYRVAQTVFPEVLRKQVSLRPSGWECLVFKVWRTWFEFHSFTAGRPWMTYLSEGFVVCLEGLIVKVKREIGDLAGT